MKIARKKKVYKTFKGWCYRHFTIHFKKGLWMAEFVGNVATWRIVSLTKKGMIQGLEDTYRKYDELCKKAQDESSRSVL